MNSAASDISPEGINLALQQALEAIEKLSLASTCSQEGGESLLLVAEKACERLGHFVCTFPEFIEIKAEAK